MNVSSVSLTTEVGSTLLVADVHPQLAWILRETLWWVYGLNDKIHLHKPQAWVEEIKQTLNS